MKTSDGNLRPKGVNNGDCIVKLKACSPEMAQIIEGVLSSQSFHDNTVRRLVNGDDKIKFVTLKYVGIDENKYRCYFDALLDKFEEHGAILMKGYGNDSLGKLHVHFLFKPAHYFRYMSFVPKKCHINYIRGYPRHVAYIRKHTYE